MANTAESTRPRLLSLDALRGFDMLWLVGAGAVCRALAGEWPGAFGWLGGQMHHAAGNGFTFWDLIFPLFLFMSGASWPFSYASQLRRGLSSRSIHLRMFKRAAVLVLLSMIHCGILQFDPEKYHYASVLQRLGLTWLVAALVYVHLRPRTGVVLAVATLALYQVLLCTCGAGVVDVLDGFCAPRAWFGRDPFEVHDVPLAVLQFPLCYLGVLAGARVQRKPGGACAGELAFVGAALAVAGLALHLAGLPINKNLATPANTLFTGGLSCLLFALFHYVLDVRGCARPAGFLRPIGVNSIAAYLLPVFVPLGVSADFFFGGLAAHSPLPATTRALGQAALAYFVLWFLDRRKIYFKV